MSQDDLDHPFFKPAIDLDALAKEIARVDGARKAGPEALAAAIGPYVANLVKAAAEPRQELVFQPHWPEGLNRDGFHEFPCDDKGRNGKTWLRVMVAPDGDAHVAMQEWEDAPEGEPSTLPTARCRTGFGGGRHERTHQALLWLALAIQLDNEDHQRNR